MEWTVEHDGEYRARFTPSEDGLYKVIGRRHDARTAATSGAARSTSSVAPSDAEYFDAAMRAPLLRRMAEETEGRLLRAPTRRARLVEAISSAGKGITVVEEKRAVGHADHA